MINIIKKFFEKKSDNLKCPNCKNDKWIEGPSGGMSVNIECSKCGSRYNHMGPLGLQELEVRNDHRREERIDQILKR